MDLRDITGTRVALVEVTTRYDGLARERLRVEAERAVPGARSSQIFAEGHPGQERAVLRVLGSDDSTLAAGEVRLAPTAEPCHDQCSANPVVP